MSTKIKQKSIVAGTGCLIQGIGLIALVFGFIFGPIGFILGLFIFFLFFLIGCSHSVQYICVNCGNALQSKDVKICPVCKDDLRN